MNLEDFKEVEIENWKKISGGGNYTASRTIGGRHGKMYNNNRAWTLSVW